MQLIAEAYDILKRGLGLNESEIADIFLTWNKGVLDSFLGEPVVTKILDKAGQKGTGKWTAIAALDAGTAGGSHQHHFCVSSRFTVIFSHPDWRGRFCALLVCD
jgi:6-phosphogluconate dehydrogenase